MRNFVYRFSRVLGGIIAQALDNAYGWEPLANDQGVALDGAAVDCFLA